MCAVELVTKRCLPLLLLMPLYFTCSSQWTTKTSREFQKCHNYCSCCLTERGKGGSERARGAERNAGHIRAYFGLLVGQITFACSVGRAWRGGFWVGGGEPENFIMYFRLLSFTWQRHFKIFDICINNTREQSRAVWQPSQAEPSRAWSGLVWCGK